MKGNTAQVKEKFCTDPSKPLYPAIEVDSDFWFAWLKESDVRSFHYESETGKFTARKEERATSTNEYWYAYRKIAGKLRKVYLGAMEELTGDRLEQVAREISQPGWEFYSSRKSYPIKKLESCVTPLTAEQSYPTNKQSSCVTDDFVEALQAEVTQLRSQIEKTIDLNSAREQENKDLKRDLEETQLELQKTRSLLETSRQLEKNHADLLCECHSDAFKAADILKEALKLKANAGGAIKDKIRSAILLIDDI